MSFFASPRLPPSGPVTIRDMTKSKAVPAVRPARFALMFCLLAGSASFLLAPSSAFSQGSSQPGQSGSNAGTGGGSSSATGPAAVGAAQTQLYNVSGSNGAQVTQDHLQGLGHRR